MNLFYKVVTGKLIRIKAVKHQVIAGQIIKSGQIWPTTPIKKKTDVYT